MADKARAMGFRNLNPDHKKSWNNEFSLSFHTFSPNSSFKETKKILDDTNNEEVLML